MKKSIKQSSNNKSRKA